MRHLVALTLCLFAAVTAFAADVSGTWKVTGDVAGNPVNFSCVLTQENDKLSGTVALPASEAVLTGSVKETAVTFEFDADGYHLVFNGTLGEAGDMKGTIEVAGAQGTFTATRN